MQFLEYLRPAQLAQLLSSSSFDDLQRSEVAWMVEGLSRREGRSVETLLKPEFGLVDAILSLLIQANVSPQISLPLWRALGNAAVAEDGKYVPVLLQSSLLLQAGTMILQEHYGGTTSVLVEGLDTLSSLLFDAGVINHPSTIAARAWLPHFPQVLHSSIHEIQRHAWQTVSVALKTPPGNEHRGAELELQVYLARDSRALRVLLQALHLATTRPDVDMQLAALDVLEGFLNSSQHSETYSHWMEIDSGDETLQRLSLQGTGPVAERAGYILEMHFDDEDSEDDVPPDSSAEPFSFGTSTKTPGLAASGSALSIPVGRGRGRVIPAWMSKQS
jgi:hypothetical protein